MNWKLSKKIMKTMKIYGKQKLKTQSWIVETWSKYEKYEKV
jgi:hypothetical protein